MAALNMNELFASVEMNEPRFLSLLTNLIGESKFLQNSPSMGHTPKEDLAINHIMNILTPHMKENGGTLEVKRVAFTEGRGNLIIKYPGTTEKICSFVGSHMDVVTANPDDGWNHDPFTLSVHDNGDTLYGRGTTDCLGHVTLLTDIMVSLAEKRPTLKTSIVVIFIANEECSEITGIGVDKLHEEGYMEELRNGPMFWVDSADSQPCIGTAGCVQWQLTVTGKAFHSGLPHHGINPIEMAMDTVQYLQKQFYKVFCTHEKEKEYNFQISSTFKPTQIQTPAGSLNQIPNTCTVMGDIRVMPFYDIADVMMLVQKCVQEINTNPSILEDGSHGPFSKYTLSEEKEKQRGKVELSWVVAGENGIACSIDSVGHRAIVKATKDVLGVCKPYSITGSLPLVRNLQEAGYDLQICGYGLAKKYHAVNESASLSDMKRAVKIICGILSVIEENV